jgi:hypothetical protein
MLVRSTQYAMKQSFQRCAGVQVARDKQLGESGISCCGLQYSNIFFFYVSNATILLQYYI